MRVPKRIGFTLIELLVVVAIILLLIAMILPAIQRVRESANKVECANHLRTIGQGIHLYLVSHANYFPTGGGDNLSGSIPNPPRGLSSGGKPVSGLTQDWGWMFQILPYIDHESLWTVNRAPHPDPYGIFPLIDNVGDQEIATTPISTYFCPSRRNPTTVSTDTGIVRAVNDYAGNMGAFSPYFETGQEHDP